MNMKLINLSILILFISIFLVPSMSAAASCNQICGKQKLPFPFGFSPGCQIQLNCSSNATILAAGFPVQSVTNDTILVNLPANCRRPVEALSRLFTHNYAPTSYNAILLQNCSAPSTECFIPATTVESNFGLQACSVKVDSSISCYSETANASSFINYRNLMRSGCRYLFSAVSSDSSANSSSVSLDVQIVRVGWWLLGDCRCSNNAICESVSPPVEGNPPAYLCRCVEGFAGDGFVDGLGCRREHKSDSLDPKRHLIVFTVLVAGAMLFSCPVYILYRRWRMAKRAAAGNRGITEASPVLLSYENERQENEMMHENDKGIDVPFYNLDTILAATDNFSDANKLGRGGFGPVYKGKLSGGHEIAVKRLSSCSGQGIEEFVNEVVLIAKLQHRNLVRLLGYCIKDNEKILLYEYMPHRSLDAFIFDQHNCLLLVWKKRFDIILGIARGLLYLHQDSRLRIIHRDLKTSNILLDEDMNPKISDFGLARIVEGKKTEARTNKIVGTYGYMSPEYALDGKFSIKSDVFSFGVVVLEIISGKKNTGFYNPQEVLNLLGYAWRLWCDNKALDLVDPTLLESCEKSQAIKCINIGLLCVQEDPNDRPCMSTVVIMLGSETNIPLPLPSQPAFVVRRRLSTTSSSPSKEADKISNNELTISVTGR